jgi:mannose/fructose-specific phosphotransferase system component IIA
MSKESVRAIVAAHGDLASGLVSAVERITGRGEALAAMTNVGLGADEMEQRLRDRIEREGIRAIFTDLPSGSWTMAARRAMRGREDVVLVTGVNLAGLLEFVMRDDVDPATGARGSVERARGAISVIGGTRGA